MTPSSQFSSEPGADNDGDVVELAADADVPPILDHTSATSSSSSASGMADKAETQEMSLMREYLIACLRPGMFVSFPVRENDEDISPFFAQVLAIEPKVTTVDVCTPGNESMFLSVAVQPYDSMLPFGGQDCCAALTAAEVFIFQDEVPHEVDWGSCTIADRRNFLEWSVETSVNDGCVALRTPKVLQPPADWSLLHSKIPTLSLSLMPLEMLVGKALAKPFCTEPMMIGSAMTVGGPSRRSLIISACLCALNFLGPTSSNFAAIALKPILTIC